MNMRLQQDLIPHKNRLSQLPIIMNHQWKQELLQDRLQRELLLHEEQLIQLPVLHLLKQQYIQPQELKLPLQQELNHRLQRELNHRLQRELNHRLQRELLLQHEEQLIQLPMNIQHQLPNLQL